MPSPLRHRDFRLFVSGSFVSQLGTQVTTVAMSWHMYLLTDSAFQVGMLGLARAVPQLALTLFGGLLADAYDRRLVLGAVQVVAGLVAAALAALTLTGLASPGALFAGAVFFALGTAVETPSRQAVVPNLVASADLSAGIALNNTQQSIARVAGPSAAGIALAIIGPESCYAVDALTRLALIAALLAISRPLQGAALARPSVEAVVAGVRFVRGQPVILSFMPLDFGATLFATSNSLLPIYARDILDAGAVGLGLLHAAPAIGALAAGTVMSTVARVDRAGRCVLLGVAFYALCTIGFALSRELWLSSCCWPAPASATWSARSRATPATSCWRRTTCAAASPPYTASSRRAARSWASSRLASLPPPAEPPSPCWSAASAPSAWLAWSP